MDKTIVPLGGLNALFPTHRFCRRGKKQNLSGTTGPKIESDSETFLFPEIYVLRKGLKTVLTNRFTSNFTFLKLPRAHHRSLKSTNVLERLNEEIKRRTRVVRIFPNPESCLRLIRALCSEVHDHWVSGKRYLDITGEKPEKNDQWRSHDPPDEPSSHGPFLHKID